MMLRHAAIALLLVACNAPDRKPAPRPVIQPTAPVTTPRPKRTRPDDVVAVPPFQVDAVRLAGNPPQPTTVRVSSPGSAHPTAYVFLGTQCPTTAEYVERIAALEQRYGDRVDFVYLYPNHADTPEVQRAYHAQHGLRGPLVDDKGAVLTVQLGIQRTAEMVLARPDGTIVYRGAIDDAPDPAMVTRQHAALAIDELLAGKPVSLPKTTGTA
jgi:hypothetical protein